MSDEEDFLPLAPHDPSTERLVNLFMLLQSTKYGLSRAQIFQKISAYQNSTDTASERMFERDKSILLSAGIQVETIFDPIENEYSYKISRDRVLLPELSLSSDELKALYYASLVWRNSDLRESALELGVKLQTYGIDGETPQIDWSYGVTEHLPTILMALQDRKILKFHYRKPQHEETDERTLEVWGVTYRPTNWYVFGLDQLRGEPRAFNLRRIVGECEIHGARNAYDIPDDINVEELLNPVHYAETFTKVKIRVEAGKGIYWRKLAKRDLTTLSEDIFEVELINPLINVPRLAADAPGVIVVEPEDIKKQVHALLRDSVM